VDFHRGFLERYCLKRQNGRYKYNHEDVWMTMERPEETVKSFFWHPGSFPVEFDHVVLTTKTPVGDRERSPETQEKFLTESLFEACSKAGYKRADVCRIALNAFFGASLWTHTYSLRMLGFLRDCCANADIPFHSVCMGPQNITVSDALGMTFLEVHTLYKVYVIRVQIGDGLLCGEVSLTRAQEEVFLKRSTEEKRHVEDLERNIVQDAQKIIDSLPLENTSSTQHAEILESRNENTTPLCTLLQSFTATLIQTGNKTPFINGGDPF
jgi:hypothetical protein